MLQIFRDATADILEALRLRRIWIALASEDITDRHRRMMLGPLWILLNYFALLAIFIFLFGRGANVVHFPAYAGVGLFVWTFISEILGNSAGLFVREQGLIKGTVMPLSLYVMRATAQSVIRSGYLLVGCLAILILTDTPFFWAWGYSLIGMLVVVVAAPAAALVLAFLGAYIPDSQHIIGNAMRIGMFLTPIFWEKGSRGGFREKFYDWNPFTHFLDIVRDPILYGTFPHRAMLICIVLTALAWLVALFVLGRFRRNVVFVL